MTTDQIKRAIKAKLKSKSNMPDWYYNRLEKCLGCEYNSGNSEKLTFKDRIRVAHNFGKDACLKCTCGIEDKCSDKEEECPEGFWDKEKGLPLDTLKVYSESKKAKLFFDIHNKRYVVDYSIIPYKFESSFLMIIEDKNIENLSVTTSCGCTTANPRYSKKGIELSISYDTLRVGEFNKRITLNYIKDKKPSRTIIIIKGKVNTPK